MLERLAGFDVEWAVLERQPPNRLLVVAADGQPMVGSADVEVPASSPGGPLTLRGAPACTAPTAGPRRDRRLGSGGMGAVYLAERDGCGGWIDARSVESAICTGDLRSDDGELRQKVAVKLLRRGLDSEELVRRFQLERQILADLAHPYVARLLDAGTAADGQPFLVMEYVAGEPIDVFCDRRRLGTRRRVELFRRVCAAVHFAHSNLVVHRDLKPANVLVAADGTPKLLDFGVARLLDRDARLTSVTTAPGTSPLTYLYASPEQVAGGAITTATDVYALGVVLYQLLTGRLPHSEQEVRRLEVVSPLKPSLAAARRGGGRRAAGGDPRRLARALRGDLDNIVLKALQLEPDRRFSSAEHLSEDLRRYLEGLPVRSRPDGFVYRAGKFVRRNVLGVAAAASVAALVLAFGVVMGAQRQTIAHQKAELERERDRAEAVKTFLEDFLKSPDRGESLTVSEALDAGLRLLARERGTDPELRAELLDTVGGVYRNLAFYDKSRPLLEEALELRLRLYGEDHVLTAETWQNLASLEHSRGRTEQAERLMRRALRIQRRGFPEGHRDLARGMNNLALLLRAKGELEEAENLAREALSMKEALFGPQHPEVTAPLNTLAAILRNRGKLEESEALYRRCVDLRRRLEGGASPRLANALNGLAGLLIVRGEPRAAEPLYEEALEIRRQVYASDHPRIVSILNNLGRLRILLGEPASASALLEEGRTMARRLGDPALLDLLGDAPLPRQTSLDSSFLTNDPEGAGAIAPSGER